jgi:hypothetical protein
MTVFKYSCKKFQQVHKYHHKPILSQVNISIHLLPISFRAQTVSMVIILGWTTICGTIPGRDHRLSSSPKCPNQLWGLGTLCVLLRVPESLSLMVNCLESEADYSLLPSAEVKNNWNHTSTPPHAFMVCTQTHP